MHFGLRNTPVQREILRYAWKTALLRMTASSNAQATFGRGVLDFASV